MNFHKNKKREGRYASKLTSSQKAKSSSVGNILEQFERTQVNLPLFPLAPLPLINPNQSLIITNNNRTVSSSNTSEISLNQVRTDMSETADEFINKHVSGDKNNNMINRQRKAEKNNLGPMFLPDANVIEASDFLTDRVLALSDAMADQNSTAAIYSMSSSLTENNNTNNNNQINTQHSSTSADCKLPPRVQSLNLTNAGKTELILEVYGFDSSKSEAEILEYLKNIAISEPNNTKDSSKNVTPMQYSMEMLIKGVVYIKFENNKSAYLYHANLREA